MEIKIANRVAEKDKVQVDVIETQEVKRRISPEKLKQDILYLQQSIANFEAELDKKVLLLQQIYAEIEKK